MILSMSRQAVLFFMTIGIGFVIGLVYDGFRILRKIIYHPDFLTYLEDVIYWLIVSVIMFYIMLNKNYGEIRFFSILGVFLGMCLYFLTLSALILKISLTIINFIKKLIIVIVKIILAPFKLIYRLAYPPVIFCKKKIVLAFLAIKKFLHKSKNYAKIKKKKFTNDFRIILSKK